MRCVVCWSGGLTEPLNCIFPTIRNSFALLDKKALKTRHPVAKEINLCAIEQRGEEHTSRREQGTCQAATPTRTNTMLDLSQGAWIARLARLLAGPQWARCCNNTKYAENAQKCNSSMRHIRGKGRWSAHRYHNPPLVQTTVRALKSCPPASVWEVSVHSHEYGALRRRHRLPTNMAPGAPAQVVHCIGQGGGGGLEECKGQITPSLAVFARYHRGVLTGSLTGDKNILTEPKLTGN